MKKNKLFDWTAIILAGGESRRMGQSKPLIELNGISSIDKVLEAIMPAVDQTVIITNEQDLETMLSRQSAKVEVLLDLPEYRGDGPLAGLYTGMNAIPSQIYFVCAADMPLLEVSYFLKLRQCIQQLSNSEDFDAFIPLESVECIPFAGAYRCGVKDIFRKSLENKQRSWKVAAKQLNIFSIPETTWRTWVDDKRALFNMNTPSDLSSLHE